MSKRKNKVKQYEDLPLKWNVYYQINAAKIEVFNIFEHIRFKTDVCKHLQGCTDKIDFSEKLRRELFYDRFTI